MISDLDHASGAGEEVPAHGIQGEKPLPPWEQPDRLPLDFQRKGRMWAGFPWLLSAVLAVVVALLAYELGMTRQRLKQAYDLVDETYQMGETRAP